MLLTSSVRWEPRSPEELLDPQMKVAVAADFLDPAQGEIAVNEEVETDRTFEIVAAART